MKQLDFAQSVTIVQSALRQTTRRPQSILSHDTSLRDVLEEPSDLDLFRRTLVNHVKSFGFTIKPSDISIELHSTIGHLAHALSASALPDDPTIPYDN